MLLPAGFDCSVHHADVVPRFGEDLGSDTRQMLTTIRVQLECAHDLDDLLNGHAMQFAHFDSANVFNRNAHSLGELLPVPVSLKDTMPANTLAETLRTGNVDAGAVTHLHHLVLYAVSPQETTPLNI